MGDQREGGGGYWEDIINNNNNDNKSLIKGHSQIQCNTTRSSNFMWKHKCLQITQMILSKIIKIINDNNAEEITIPTLKLQNRVIIINKACHWQIKTEIQRNEIKQNTQTPVHLNGSDFSLSIYFVIYGTVTRLKKKSRIELSW